MYQPKFSDATGNAVLEFVAFVMVAQLLVFAIGLSISNELSEKVSLQLSAMQTARSVALHENPVLSSSSSYETEPCGEKVVCLVFHSGGRSSRAVSYAK